MRALGLLLGIITIAGLGGCSGNPCDGAGGACVDCVTVTSTNAALLVGLVARDRQRVSPCCRHS